jgi:Carboxypeptidase regulatory-like domain
MNLAHRFANTASVSLATLVCKREPTAKSSSRLIVKVALLWAFLVLTLQGLPIFGQNRNAGEIRGTVLDSAGALVPGVSVDATNTATGVQVHGLTGSVGQYDIPYVSAGEYDVTFTKDGFDKFVQKGVVLHIETITLNATLRAGSVSTSITVTRAPALLQTETSEVSQVMTQEQVADLPLVGGNWESFAVLNPGTVIAATASTQSGFLEGVSVNGSQGYQAVWLLDGGNATLPESYNPDLISPPAEAIQEVDTSTSTMGAETGNGEASFNVILKGGTNKFHGSVYEFVQNDIFNAAPKNWSSVPQPKPPLRWNMFGVDVGGPIVRDKLFFFFGFQDNPIRTYAPTLYTYPTDDMRAGNFAGLSTIYDPSTTTTAGGTTTRTAFANNQLTRLDPVALAIQKFFPEPNAINPNNPWYNNYYYAAVNPSDQHWYIYKVDYNLTSTNRLSADTLNTARSYEYPTPDCPIDCQPWRIADVAGQLTDTQTFSTTKLNEFRAAFARETVAATNASVGKGYPAQIGLPNLPSDAFPVISASTGPGIQIGGLVTAGVLAEESIVPSDTFSWIFAKHNVKVGGEFDYWYAGSGWGTVDAGNFNFTGIATRDPNSNDANQSPGVGYADFLLGAPQSWNDSIQIVAGTPVKFFQLFAQDYYKIRSNLTLNYGVRFTYQRGFTEEHNRFANYDPTLLNPATNTPGAIGYAGVQIPKVMQASVPFFAPRVGFAWALNPSTVLRGGFGIYPLPWSLDDYVNNAGLGWAIQGAEQSTDNLTPIFQLSNGPPSPVVPTAATRTPSLLNGQNVILQPYKTPMAYLEQYQLGVQKQFGQYALQAVYVGSAGRKIDFAPDINQVPESQLGSGVRPNPNFQSITAFLNIGESNYNSLQLIAQRQMVNGFSLRANYTWSKSMDTGTSQGGQCNCVDVLQNSYSTRQNYGPSANDVRQILNGTALYQLPFGRQRRFLNSSAVADAVLGGWQIGTTFQATTGRPFTPVMSNNLSGALSESWFPNRAGTITVPHPSPSEWFNVNAFSTPPVNTFGNAGRNILYGPRFVTINSNLSKSFPLPNMLGEAARFQVRMDVVDTFNHPNYGQPDYIIGSAGVGTISSSTTNRGLQFDGILRF